MNAAHFRIDLKKYYGSRKGKVQILTFDGLDPAHFQNEHINVKE